MSVCKLKNNPVRKPGGSWRSVGAEDRKEEKGTSGKLRSTPMEAKWVGAQAGDLGCLSSNPVSVALGN